LSLYLGSLTFLGTTLPLAAFALPAPVLSDETDVNLKILCPLAATFFYIIVTISVLMILYAAYLYLTAAGDTAKIKQAGQIITYGVIGVVVALLANNVPAIVGGIMGWNTVKRC